MDPLTPASQAPTLPKVVAIAGLVFSSLMIIGLGIVRLAFPDTPAEQITVKHGFRNEFVLAVHIVPFAGIAFLWFLGVLRDRIGTMEDRFFGTVFLGSGLLFVACLFASAAIAASILGITQASGQPLRNDVYFLARHVGYAFLNIFAIKMAGVFIMSTCTIALRTAIFPRWIAFSGYACGLVLLIVITDWPWIAMLFPLWTTLVSLHILVARREREG